MYNVRKLTIFAAIRILHKYRIPPTYKTLSYVIGYKVHVQLSKYLRMKYIEVVKDGQKAGVYYLTKKGRSVYSKLVTRYNAGQDLNIRRVPKPFDWSTLNIMPDPQRLEELIENAERERNERRKAQRVEQSIKG